MRTRLERLKHQVRKFSGVRQYFTHGIFTFETLHVPEGEVDHFLPEFAERAIQRVDAKFPWRDVPDEPDGEENVYAYRSFKELEYLGCNKGDFCENLHRFRIVPAYSQLYRAQVYAYQKYLTTLALELARFAKKGDRYGLKGLVCVHVTLKVSVEAGFDLSRL